MTSHSKVCWSREEPIGENNTEVMKQDFWVRAGEAQTIISGSK